MTQPRLQPTLSSNPNPIPRHLLILLISQKPKLPTPPHRHYLALTQTKTKPTSINNLNQIHQHLPILLINQQLKIQNYLNLHQSTSNRINHIIRVQNQPLQSITINNPQPNSPAFANSINQPTTEILESPQLPSTRLGQSQPDYKNSESTPTPPHPANFDSNPNQPNNKQQQPQPNSPAFANSINQPTTEILESPQLPSTRLGQSQPDYKNSESTPTPPHPANFDSNPNQPNNKQQQPQPNSPAFANSINQPKTKPPETNLAKTVNGKTRQESTKKPEAILTFVNFEKARSQPKKISSKLIRKIIEDDNFDLKKFVTTAKPTETDIALINDSSQIADLYLATTEAIKANIALRVDNKRYDPQSRQNIERRLGIYFSQLTSLYQETTRQIKDCCDLKTNLFPSTKTEYRNLTINGHDILDADNLADNGIRSNIQITKRQRGSSVIKGISNQAFSPQFADKKASFNRCVHLNPNVQAAPVIFGELLSAANSSKTPVIVNMLNQVSAITLTKRGQSYENRTHRLPTTGLEVHLPANIADEFLGEIFSIVRRHQGEFDGRRSQLIAHELADGVAISDLTNNKSLRDRLEIIEIARKKVIQSSKQGKQATALFINLLREQSEARSIDFSNFAFNLAKKQKLEKPKESEIEKPKQSKSAKPKEQARKQKKQSSKQAPVETKPARQPEITKTETETKRDSIETLREALSNQSQFIDLFSEVAEKRGRKFDIRSFLESLNPTAV